MSSDTKAHNSQALCFGETKSIEDLIKEANKRHWKPIFYHTGKREEKNLTTLGLALDPDTGLKLVDFPKATGGLADVFL